MTPRLCLVTGGAGFIGSHVVRRLLADGHAVRVVDNFVTGSADNLAEVADDIELVTGDLVDPDVCERSARGAEVVFHLAALGSVPRSMQNPWASHQANVNATVRLIEAARAAGARRVVFSSSSSLYGDTPTLPKVETQEPLPRSPYAASKLAAEQYVLAYARAGMLEGVALRYFNVFGPRQSPTGPYAAIIPLLLRAAHLGEAVTLNGDGGQTRDFTYVDNVVDANMLAAFGPAERVSGTVANAGAGGRTSLLELVALLERVSGRPIEVRHGPPRVGDVRDSLASLERARGALGYDVAVGVEEGLRRTWEWWLREGAARHLPAGTGAG
ncbi:NAD-dependent epimerase/dehydratase family protein [Roseisolibacter sp. H3M3-2]|uniref:NAD-dependent epimerase/dehydratase family protein n=1 Tax=Roseisolibacter sp. H3M3-2 TaxID=3031323 RepID=UPI0023DA8836|nr:NAD-dependent epimerase/dehydratase family protein [Roseisolibacter sp. H3M3-2]MDF1504471.1 NAD-dependent epimerase/dehydratase family protein [Roseisolibacter sp. H3M3-2]